MAALKEYLLNSTFFLQRLTASNELSRRRRRRMSVLAHPAHLQQKALLICAFLTCVGMTFLIIACAVPTPKIFYPFFVLLFYVLSVLPVIISKRFNQGNETNPRTEFALFLTAGMVLSAFAFPIVLAHAGTISWLACNLTLLSNVVNYLTMFGYAMKDDEFGGAPYGGMF